VAVDGGVDGLAVGGVELVLVEHDAQQRVGICGGEEGAAGVAADADGFAGGGVAPGDGGGVGARGGDGGEAVVDRVVDDAGEMVVGEGAGEVGTPALGDGAVGVELVAVEVAAGGDLRPVGAADLILDGGAAIDAEAGQEDRGAGGGRGRRQ